MQKAIDYLNSEQGKKDIEKSLEKSRDVACKLRKLREIDPKILWEPMTI